MHMSILPSVTASTINLINFFGIPSHPRKARNKLWILDAATGQDEYYAEFASNISKNILNENLSVHFQVMNETLRFSPNKMVPIISSVFKHCTWSHWFREFYLFIYFLLVWISAYSSQELITRGHVSFREGSKFCMPRCANKLIFFPELTLGSDATDTEVVFLFLLLLFLLLLFGLYILGSKYIFTQIYSTFTVP